MPSFTPGPWQWDGNDLDGPNYAEVIRASVSCGAWCQGGYVNLDVSKANAALIAAAPRMYDALRKIAAEDHPDGFFARIANKALEGLE